MVIPVRAGPAVTEVICPSDLECCRYTLSTAVAPTQLRKVATATDQICCANYFMGDPISHQIILIIQMVGAVPEDLISANSKRDWREYR